jgi:hypothetical protein
MNDSQRSWSDKRGMFRGLIQRVALLNTNQICTLLSKSNDRLFPIRFHGKSARGESSDLHLSLESQRNWLCNNSTRRFRWIFRVSGGPHKSRHSLGMGQRTIRERRFVSEYSHSRLNFALSIGSGERTPALTGDGREDSPFEEISPKDFCLVGDLKAR